jgi:DNA-binding MarR family transcriptional regulator
MAEIHAAIECLQRLTAAFQLRREQLASGVGLTEHQWSVLEEISTEHFMPSMFARRRESTPAAVSKTIRQLIDKGVISVSVASQDGRQRHYELTAKGKRTVAKLRNDRQQAVEHVWKKLDLDDLKHFTRFGQELRRRLEDYATSTHQVTRSTNKRPAGTET